MKTSVNVPRKVAKKYLEIWRFLIWNKWLIGLSLLYLAEIIIFFAINGSPDNHYANYVETYRNYYPSLFLFIFLENLKALIATILMGCIPAFVGSVFATMMIVRQAVATAKMLSTTIPIHAIIIAILPHGIFEIPAIIFSVLLSTILSKEITLIIVKLIARKRTHSPIFAEIQSSIFMLINCWIFIVLPLILLSAIIEVTISLFVVQLLI